MTRPLSAVLAALLVTSPLAADAPQAVSSPVFRGVMGMGQRALVLFELPGQSGNWQGEAGAKVPGTSWTIQSATLNPGQVVIAVPGRGAIRMTQGQTYLGGATAVLAASVERPANKPAAEFVPSTPEQVAAENRRRQAARLAAAIAERQRAAAAAKETHEEPDEPAPGLVLTLDVAKYDPPVHQLGQAGFDTVFMVTSKGSDACEKTAPSVSALARKPQKRVVFLDIGTTSDGKVDSRAPILRNRRIQNLPYFFVVDQAGKLFTHDEAVAMMRSW